MNWKTGAQRLSRLARLRWPRGKRARHSRGWAVGSLSMGVRRLRLKPATTHVETSAEVPRDAGSIPAASMK